MTKEKKTRLSTKISTLTVVSSACAILVLGIALILMFTFFFSQQTREDIAYYLENTNEQFDAKVQFIQDSTIAIRHNTIMEEFFKRNHYDEEEVERQLAYCMDLFSDRNMVSQNAPFAVSVYLFNNKGDTVRKHYYPTTLSKMEEIDASYEALLPGGSKTICCESAGAGYMLGKTGDPKRQEASIRFLKYMLSREVQERILLETQQVPANPNIRIEDYADQMPRFSQAVSTAQQAEIKIEIPEQLWANQQIEVFSKNIYSVLNGDFNRQTFHDLLR